MISGSSESPSGLPVEVAALLEKPVSEAQLLASLRPLLVSPALQRNWLVARHGYRTPAQVRADQRRLDQDAVDDLQLAAIAGIRLRSTPRLSPADSVEALFYCGEAFVN